MAEVKLEVQLKTHVTKELSEEEHVEYVERCQVIFDNQHQGAKIKSEVLNQIDIILQKKLWREEFPSEEDFIKTILGIEVSSVRRHILANKAYLFLVQSTDDEQEIATLSMLKESVYRELRRLATDATPMPQHAGEPDEEYQARRFEKLTEDLESIHSLWTTLYPKIKFHKEQSNSGLLPNGGFSISARDISDSAIIIRDALTNQQFNLEGRSIPLEDVVEVAGDRAAQAADDLLRLGVHETLGEKDRRQLQHIADKAQFTFIYDKWEGVLEYKQGRLGISNENGFYAIEDLWVSDLGRETCISIRRELKRA